MGVAAGVRTDMRGSEASPPSGLPATIIHFSFVFIGAGKAPFQSSSQPKAPSVTQGSPWIRFRPEAARW
jgi:hypothetical protein